MIVNFFPPSVVSIQVVSESETDLLGRALADWVRPGTVIGLVGPLGAGKTRLVRSLSEALGVDPREIASPTFILIHEYEGRLPIYHFDTYRLASPDEFDALGVSDYFESDGLCLIEWADRVADRLPPETWTITIAPDGERRRFTLNIPQPDRFVQHLQGARQSPPRLTPLYRRSSFPSGFERAPGLLHARIAFPIRGLPP